MSGPTLITPKVTKAQQTIISMLEEAIAETLRGNVSSIGIIVCMPSGYATVMAGTQAADLNMGCDSLKRKILDEIESGNKKEAPRPSGNIIRATPR